MNFISLAFGIAALAYGIFTLIQRKRAPEKFGKLDAMKKQYGEKAGYLVHTVLYSFVPLGVGATALMMGIKGKSFF